MSKARLVITALFLDHQTPAEVAARDGVHRSWVYRLKARYEAEGEAAFEPRSRAPRNDPNATPAATAELVLRIRKQLADAGHDAGADTIRGHLQHHHQVILCRATIHRTYAGTYVRLLVHELQVGVVDLATGELLRELTLDPTKDYQPIPPRTPK